MLRVEDLTRQVAVVEAGRVAGSYWTRLRGLMGVRSLAPGDGLLLAPANCIHTHFMALPIDVLYVRPDGQIVDIDEQLPPWRFGRLRRAARLVIELPAGTVATKGIAVGDRLAIHTGGPHRQS
jgi:uncharacterized membrane protein (UPF0127 family)